MEVAQAKQLAKNLERLTAHVTAGSRDGAVYTFLPRNNMLYSIALYCLIPLSVGFHTHVRAPAALRDLVTDLWELTGLGNALPASLHLKSQREFTGRFTAHDTILFTGQTENGKTIDRDTPHNRFLGFGSSLNPAVILPDADIAKACEDVIFARLFNAGADCLAPDIVFVHAAVHEEFCRVLTDMLSDLPLVSSREAAASISHTASPDSATAERAHQLIALNSDRVIWRAAEADFADYVPTTVLSSTIDEAPSLELFAPIFNLATYTDLEQVAAALRSPGFAGVEMYLSVYGDPVERFPGGYRVCRDSTPFHHESALRPFGGYGVNATWLTTEGGTMGCPLSVFHVLRSEPCA